MIKAFFLLYHKTSNKIPTMMTVETLPTAMPITAPVEKLLLLLLSLFLFISL